MNSSTRTAIGDALDVIAERDVTWTWGVSWTGSHNGNTSQLGGFKPGSRRDSQGAQLYVVGIFRTSKKEILPPPLIQATFANEPTTAEIVAGLRQALANA